MLWEVAGTNLQLLGTIHVSDRPLELHDRMIEAMRSAVTFVFEQNLDHQPDTPLRFSSGVGLSTHIPQTLYAETVRVWSELGLSLYD
jgi:uncharacterized protein YbaP (TraB family)